jgi:hypothetical protein
MSEHPQDDTDLLDVERELNAAEQQRLRQLGERSWLDIQASLSSRAKAVYAAAAPEDFAECVGEHMEGEDRTALALAEVYQCPRCARLLKDRKTPVASALLQERLRIQQLWMDVEKAQPKEMDEAVERFRRALGLPT